MRFTLSWLKTHLDTDAPLDLITDRLTGIGLELEAVTDPGAPLAAFRVAEVLTAEPHPNADRLRACTVLAGPDLNGGAPISVVCGAPNARAGMKAVFAPPGSHIPGTGVTLKTGEIRGVTSAGMLLSLREMALGESHDGILELPADAPVGTPYPLYANLSDPLVEIGVTPNRGDALGVRGVARDLAAAGLGTLRPLDATPVPGRFDSPLRWAVETPACPWILGRTIRGVRNGPSPAWLQRRLTAIGLRPISALVDITNFFCFDLGRPLHVFDADRVAGHTLTLRPGADESFAALNGKDYTLTPDDCVIADGSGPVSLAGVMGGATTGATADTTTVFLECALFDPVSVALTGRRHALTSDARQRFERGVDPALLPAALEAATRMVIDLCGGEASHPVEAGAEPGWRRTATLRFARLLTLGGAAIPPRDATTALERLGFTVTAEDAEQVTVAVPSWRSDIAAPITLDPSPTLGATRTAALLEACRQAEPEADLVEEVLRLHGLDTIPPISLPPVSLSPVSLSPVSLSPVSLSPVSPAAAAVPAATLTPRQTRTALARRAAAAAGLLECVTFSFMDANHAALFGGTAPELRLANPISADLGQMRPTPVATLAAAAARNAARGLPDTLLTETGPAFHPANTEGALQETVTAGLLAGHTPRTPGHPARPRSAADAKAAAFSILARLGVPPDSLLTTPTVPGAEHACYHPGQSGQIRQGRLLLATFGTLHPRVVAALSLPPAAAFEIFLDRLPDGRRRRRAAPTLSPFQPVRRDFAFLVPLATDADSLLRAARAADRTLITEVTLFDVFESPTLPPGQKSLALEVTLQPRDHTLTDPEIATASAKIIAAITKATGATLR